MTNNRIFHADRKHILAVTTDSRLIRNISRSKKAETWTLIASSWNGKKQERRYFIPNKYRKQAEKFFNVETSRKS